MSPTNKRDNLGLANLLNRQLEEIESMSDDQVLALLERAWRSERGRLERNHWSGNNLRFIALAHHISLFKGQIS